MQVTYHIDTEKKIVFIKAIGEISIDDLITLEKRLLDDPLFEEGMNSFSDFSKAWPKDNVDIDKIKMSLEFIKSVQEKRGKCRWAIFAPKDYLYTFWLIFEGFSDELHVDVKVFKKEDEAKQWLGL